MFKKIWFSIVLLLVPAAIFAQADSSHLRISLLTCGVGDEIWETFGHTAIRITDSARGTDMVYNYGTFDGYDKNFEVKFMRGKLLYYVSYDPFRDFMTEYIEGKRSVQEQVLLLTGPQKEDIYSFLQWNAQNANKYYKYDFFFDNCATRIRDIFPKTFGSNFKFGRVIPEHSHITYRDIINRYLYKLHWERLGINILLGSKVDKVMSNEDIMFLPDYLRDGVGGATVNGRKIAAPVQTILPGKDTELAGFNGALLLMCVLAALTILGLTVRPLRLLGRLMSTLLLFVTGVLGLLILFMWLGTDHQACQNNWNILWAIPTNIIIAANTRRKDRYAMVAIILLIVSLLLHVLGIQALPLPELAPLLLAMLFIYGTIYRRNRIKTT